MVLAKSRRLIIRPFLEKDIIPYFEIINDEEVMKFIGDGSVQTMEEAKTYITECMNCFVKHGWSRFAVELKETRELIGFCGFKRYNGELDFGWRYRKEFWGQGIGYEAALAVLDLAKSKFNFSKIVCISHPENIGSLRIIDKLGFSFEKEIYLNNRKLVQFSSEILLRNNNLS
jgi:RimJ/RimL family protein N-acetyltransferase